MRFSWIFFFAIYIYIYTPVLVSLFGSVALPYTNYITFTEILPYAEAGWALVELPRNYSRRAWADATLRALDTKEGWLQTWEPTLKENGPLSNGKVFGVHGNTTHTRFNSF